jgi:hypothetical protein
MKQVSLKIKSYAGNLNGRVSIVNNSNLERRILHSMLFSLGVLAIFYVFLLANMVVNIVERKSFETSARALSNEVSGLELNYLSLSNGINQSLGLSMGFQEPPTQYATRKALGFVTPSVEGSVNNIASRSL